MNTPGVPDGNWAWRAADGAFTDDLVARLRETVQEADRS
jgi:4-alpha-glucanotransferase